MSGHPQPSANDQNTSSLTTQEQADTHRSLQQASQALELASNRIRQVRRSLLQLSESLPSNESIVRGAYNELRPAYDALVLTGADGVQRPTSVRADRRRLRNTFTLEGTGSSSSTGATVQTEHSTGSAASALASRLDVLRSMINADPSATTRGMRVAVRQAMMQQAQDTPDGSTTAPEDHGELLFTPDPTPEQTYASIQARYERLQHLLSSGNLYDDFQGVDGTDAPGPSSSIAERVTRRWGPLIPLTTDAISAPAPSSTPFSLPPLPADHSRSGQSTPRPLPATSLPSDTTTVPTAGVLAGSVERHRLVMQNMLLSDYPIFNPEQARGDTSFWRSGQELGSSSGGDSQDDLRRQYNHIFQYITTPDTEVNSQLSQSQPPDSITENDGSLPDERSSRRAWARLDADGDEIPPNEEEELERQRTSYRIRAQQRVRQHIAPSQVDSIHSFERPDGPRDMHGSVIDSTRTVPDVRRQQLSPPVYTPVSTGTKDSYVNPLPMPLESMLMTTDTQKEEDIFIDIVLPNDTCIAGR